MTIRSVIFSLCVYLVQFVFDRRLLSLTLRCYSYILSKQHNVGFIQNSLVPFDISYVQVWCLHPLNENQFVCAKVWFPLNLPVFGLGVFIRETGTSSYWHFLHEWTLYASIRCQQLVKNLAENRLLIMFSCILLPDKVKCDAWGTVNCLYDTHLSNFARLEDTHNLSDYHCIE